MKKCILLAASLVLAAAGINAQSPEEGNGLDLSGDMSGAQTAQPKQDMQPGQADWFVDMDYAGFDFQLPAGLLVDKGSSFVAKSEDATFGLSMSNESRYGSNQQIAFELCRRLASELKLPAPKVQKAQYGKCKGAIATDMMDGMQITVLVLPYDGQQVTTVIFNTPLRQNWTDTFLRTLKR